MVGSEAGKKLEGPDLGIIGTSISRWLRHDVLPGIIPFLHRRRRSQNMVKACLPEAIRQTGLTFVSVRDA